jgi:hypothetical protein
VLSATKEDVVIAQGVLVSPNEIPVNRAFLIPDYAQAFTLRHYFTTCMEKLKVFHNEVGKRLVNEKREFCQTMVVRGLLFVGRPDCFINDRWPMPRTTFTDIYDMNTFLCRFKHFVNDFYKCCCRGKIGTGVLPTERSLEELSQPRRRKMMLKRWQRVLVF